MADDLASSSGESFCSVNQVKDKTHCGKNEVDKRLLSRYRLLYTSFVRCMRYLSQIKDDAVSGRLPSFIDYGMAGGGISQVPTSGGPARPQIGANKSLRSFLSRAHGVVITSQRQDESAESSESEDPDCDDLKDTMVLPGKISRKVSLCSIQISTELCQLTLILLLLICHFQRKDSSLGKKKGKKPKFANSMITQRLLGPSSGHPGNLSLPWSCAIYSIVNWMVAFSDVEGIQAGHGLWANCSVQCFSSFLTLLVLFLFRPFA